MTQKRSAFKTSLAGIAALAGALAFAPDARAQLPYLIEELSESYVSRNGTQVPIFDFDNGEGQVTLPFTFRFFRESHNTVNIGVNGYVAFGENATSNQNQALPNTATPNNLIAPYWEDLFAGNLTYTTEGSSPNRIFIVQWSRYQTNFFFGEQFDMQLWLYESPPGRFDVRYGPNFGMQFPPIQATMGFEDDTGTAGHDFAGCGNGCNGGQFRADVVYRATLEGGTDLYALDVDADVQGTPLRLYQGIPFDASAKIASFHDGPLGPFVYSYYLLGINETTPSTPAIYTSAEITLNNFESRTVTDSVSVPLNTPPGRYRMAVVLDTANQIDEPEEGNNIALGNRQFLVGARAPDLQISNIEPAPGPISPGSTLDVTANFLNAGNLEASADWRIVLSQNRAPSSNDRVLASSSSPLSLGIGESSEQTISVTIPSDIRPGRYYFGAVIDPVNSISELIETNNTVRSENQFDIEIGTVDLTTSSLPVAYVGVPFSTRLVASGGDGTFVWELMGGTLPPGLTFVAGPVGELRGTPTEVGSASLTFRVSSNGADDTATLTLDVLEVGGPLTIVTRNVLPGIVGQTYPPAEGGVEPANQQRIVAVGGDGPATFTLVSGGPAGLVMDPDGYLHGTPQTRGTFSLEVSATDGATTVMREIPMTIVEPGRLTLVVGALPDASLGEPYSYTFFTVGQKEGENLSYGIDASSTAPAGLSLGTASGILEGTPMTAGTFVFAVRVVEGSGANAPNDTASVTLRVLAPEGSLSITPATIPPAVLNTEYSVTFEARQGVGPFEWDYDLPSGALPAGMSLDTIEVEGVKKLRLSGTPTALPTEESLGVNTGGVVSFLVQLTDAQGRRAEQAISLQVLPAVVVTPEGEDGGCGCRASSSASSTANALLAALLLAGVAALRRRR